MQRKVAAGVISAGHARALLSFNSAEQIEKIANRITSEGLSDRAIEELAILQSKEEKSKNSSQSNSIINNRKTPNIKILKEISDALSDRLETRVSVEEGKFKGKIIVEYANFEDLNRILKIIG